MVDTVETVVADGTIVARSGDFLLESAFGETRRTLVLDEDPAGFVGVPVRVAGVVDAQDRLVALTIERLRARHPA